MTGSRRADGRLRVLNVVGARPNFVKAASLVAAYRGHDWVDPVLVHTGQHYDEAMSAGFFRDLGLPRPDVNLEVGSGSHATQTAEIMKAFERTALQVQPDVVLVFGDVNSTIACGLVAAKNGIPLAHVEAGLRSGDRKMPEEINRVLTDAISDLLFCTEQSGVENLAREGIVRDKVFLVGNTMVDTLLRNRERSKASSVLRELGLGGGGGHAPGGDDLASGDDLAGDGDSAGGDDLAGRGDSAGGDDLAGVSDATVGYAVATLHRPSNVDDRRTLEGILDAFAELRADLPIVLPIHPRLREMLGRFGMERRPLASGLCVAEPFGYLDFLKLVDNARVVLTDSGGLQEETTALGVPCVTLRENTERPVTVEAGTNRLAGTSPDRIVTACRDAMAESAARKPNSTPPLWDGRAGERIVAVLKEKLT